MLVESLLWVGLTWLCLTLPTPLSPLARILIFPPATALLMTPFLMWKNANFRKKARKVTGKIDKATLRRGSAVLEVSWEGGKGSLSVPARGQKEGDAVELFVHGRRCAEQLPSALENCRLLILCGLLMALGALGYGAALWRGAFTGK